MAQISPQIRIAIADDHPILRSGLKHLLSLEPDFQVVAEVDNGDDVLPAVEDQQPDILLIDPKMPGTHGLTILQRLQLARNGVTKAIILTASEEKSELVQAMKLGACGIVLKQSPADALFKAIRKVHAGGIWLDSDIADASREREQSLSKREREVRDLIARLRNRNQ